MKGERDSSGGEAATGIRHHVTVMFSDLCSSTLVGHGSDPEVLDAVLREVKAAAARVVAQHDGVVNQFYGDGVMAIFGFPTPREDDVRRAAEAALELHRAVRNLSFASLPRFSARLHTGIHSGLVLVREGDPAQGRYEMVGDPVNTAAGISASAGVDEILVDAPTIRGVLPFFDAQEIEPVRLKGKPDPIPAFRLQGQSEVATRFEARTRLGLTPFVGRQRELERLSLRLREVRQGRLIVVRLVGDAGIGKSRAVEEFIGGEEARECLVYRGYCESVGSVPPLQPFLLMLGQIFQLARDLTTESAIERIETRLGELGLERHAREILRILALRTEPPGSGASDGQRHLAEATAPAVAELLLALASSKPLVLIIDDWQWVDDASRQVVASLLRANRGAPVLLLTASRQVDPRDAEGDGIEILKLAPFEESESAQAAHALLPDELDLGMASVLHQRSGGNPLFLEELCQLLRGVTRAPGPDVPVTLHELIEARVHRLPPEQAELVRAAAVIGNVIPCWLLEQISGYGKDDEILRELASNDLIHAGETAGTLRFKHGITREVVYQSVGLAQRRALHLRIGAILEEHPTLEGRDEPYEALAYHHAGGEDHLKASRYAELAGDKAMASATLDRARQHYAAALASLDRLEPTQERRRLWLEISRRRAFACIFSPAPEQLETLGRAAEYAAELGDLDALGHARFWLGYTNYCLGNHKESVDQYQQAMRIAEDAGNAKLIAQLRANLGETLATALEYPEALAFLDEFLEARKRLKSSLEPRFRGRGSSAYAIGWKASVKAELGDFAQAHDLMAQALEAVRGLGSPVEGSIRGLQAIILSWQGRWKECIEIAELVRATAERVNAAYLFARSRSEGAYARYMLSGGPAAVAVLRQTTEWLESRKICLYISMNYGCLTDAMAREGDAKGARYYGHCALQRAARHDPIGQGMACRALARLEMCAREANPASAERYLAMAMESAQARGSEREIALTRLGQAELSARCGRRSEAEALLARARVALQRMDMHWHVAEAQRLADAL